MRIVADLRETASGVPSQLERLGFDVELTRLRVGDYAIGGGALVERKTTRGFHLDLLDGRFWRQLGQLRRAARMPYLLIEGADLDNGPLSRAGIRGACLAASDLGVAVIRSIDATDSALWLRILTARRRSPAPRSRPPYAGRPKTAGGVQSAEAALSAVPTISTVTARALLQEFGSLAALVAADPREWERVPGVGPHRAKALLATIRAPATTNRSRRRRERSGPST
jgi:DNA excision repair protein ERCC-4